ncbi:olfactory receptor 6N2-like [Cheilinus undulatus]|uniref:olfactory receptor 6N2-like n=1 Tax=Cheilinus undulatus TaxID=241271 RepID=UPI001BD5A0BD|nr:olfactory receptor 6N2-like [Cheilinus undulatus]
MNDDSNETYITLDGYVEVHRYRYLFFVVMLTAYILVLLFNSAVVCVTWIHKNLHEPMYIFIAALLFNSVLFSTVIYPKLLIDFLSEKQIISHSACLCQVFLFYSLGGSEFLLLAAMSYDRYVSICKPLQYPAIMRKTTVICLLLLAWLLPACQLLGFTVHYAQQQLCSFTLRGIYCNNSNVKLYCVLSRVKSLYGLVVLFNVALLLLFFIFFTYSRIFLVSYRSYGAVRKKAAETCLPHLMALISIFCFSVYDAVVIRLENDLPKTAGFVMSFQLVLYHPLFNPLMYGLKMKEISKHLKRLLWRRSLCLS